MVREDHSRGIEGCIACDFDMNSVTLIMFDRSLTFWIVSAILLFPTAVRAFILGMSDFPRFSKTQRYRRLWPFHTPTYRAST